MITKCIFSQTMVATTSTRVPQTPYASGLQPIQRPTRMPRPDAPWRVASLSKITVHKFMYDEKSYSFQLRGRNEVTQLWIIFFTLLCVQKVTDEKFRPHIFQHNFSYPLIQGFSNFFGWQPPYLF